MRAPTKSFRRLLRDDGLSLGVWSCTLDHRRPGPEQHTEVPTVNVPLRGAFTRLVEGRAELVDPLTASLSNAGETWRTTHPVACADNGVYVQLTPARAAALLPSRDDRGADAPFPRSLRRLAPADWLGWRLLVADLAAGRLEEDAARDRAERLVEALAGAPALAADTELARAARVELGRGEVPSVQELAARLGVSREHLCRAFRRATGTTVHDALDQLRLRRAADALAGGAGDLAALAAELGFAHHSHLTLRFRRAFGLPPSAWRARAGGRG